jgi:ABC-type multidrug transport system fused ATPase/permease subunit
MATINKPAEPFLKRLLLGIPRFFGVFRPQNSQLLFFRRRLPSWNDAKIPEDIGELPRPLPDNLLDGSDFISQAYLNKKNIALVPSIREDLQTLDKGLLRYFMQANQKAKFYQNLYFRYQWSLAIGAFITAVVGALALMFGITTNEAQNMADQGIKTATTVVLNIPPDTIRTLAIIFSVITAIAGFFTTYYRERDRQRKPQKLWFSWRRAAEELRKHYFQYLSRVSPYDTTERSEILASSALEIFQKGEPEE